MQLYCFPYAGGTSAFYDRLKMELPETINVVKLDYANHGNRRGEPKYNSFSELADDMYAQMRAARCAGESYALMGYSMGSLCAYEILRRIIDSESDTLPVHLFLAAHGPHPEREFLIFRSPDAEEAARKRTVRFGGIDARLLDNKTFWRIYLPIYQWDYYLIGTCEDRPIEPPVSLPTTVFYSENDTPYREMREWICYVGADCDFFRFDGNHFFMCEHCAEIAEAIQRKLMTYG